MLRSLFERALESPVASLSLVLLAIGLVIIRSILLRTPGILGTTGAAFLIARAQTKRLQQERPRDADLRAEGGIKIRSLKEHPRFAGSVSAGLQSWSNRLWTPRYILGIFDFTDQGLRWEPGSGYSIVGFSSFVIPWAELQRIVVRRTFKYAGWHTGYVTLEGAFGPPLQAQIGQFEQARKLLDSRGIPIIR